MVSNIFYCLIVWSFRLLRWLPICLWNWFLSFATCFVSRTTDSARASLPWVTFCSSAGSSYTEVSAGPGFLLLAVCPKWISKVCGDPNNSSSFILDRSLASSIVETFMLNLEGRDLRTFRTSLESNIFSSCASDSLAMSRTRTLNLAIVSSSPIWRASNRDVKICSREIFTLEVPSKATSKISQAALADLHVLISLNIFGSTTLNNAFSARELPTATSSSSFAVGYSYPGITTLQLLMSSDIRKASICDFQ